MDTKQDRMGRRAPQPARHKTAGFERGTSGDQGQRQGYAASCETCGAVTFGGFRTKTDAKAALLHSPVAL